MEKKKTIFDYTAQVMTILGFSMLVMNIFCMIFGDSAKEFSTLFALGSGGLPAVVVFQYLILSILIVLFKTIFFTDILIKKLSLALRTVFMLLATIAVIALFVVIFDWFPIDMWLSWVMFLICFGISFAISLGVTVLKEKTENSRMEEALRRLKERKD